MVAKNKRLTIILVTYNSSDVIKGCLDKLNHDMYDIFVVDNALDEETKSVVLNKTVTNNQISLHYDTEPKAGIVFARNKCVALFQEADADFLLFIDDDTKTYLQQSSTS